MKQSRNEIKISKNKKIKLQMEKQQQKSEN